MKPQTHTCVVLIFDIFYIFCYILHIPKCCAPGLPAAGNVVHPAYPLQIAYSAFFFIFYIFFAYKNRGGSYSAHILHICCIFVILKQGGFICKRGVDMPMGISYFAYSTCASYLTYSMYCTYLPYSTYFTYFAYSGCLSNPFWQMVCEGFKLSDEDEDQGQTYMSRQWLSRSPHVGAHAASASHQLQLWYNTNMLNMLKHMVLKGFELLDNRIIFKYSKICKICKICKMCQQICHKTCREICN